jgi:2-keto-3-deoxy-L-rhamnonate aldolase RhmA
MPGRFDEPEFVEALRTVVAATDAHGKTAGILLRDASTLDTYRGLGFRFIGLGSDGAFVVDGLRSVLGLARA